MAKKKRPYSNLNVSLPPPTEDEVTPSMDDAPHSGRTNERRRVPRGGRRATDSREPKLPEPIVRERTRR